MNSNQFKRWLKKQGCTFDESLGKGGHIAVYFKSKKTILPMHGKKELKKGLIEAIKKQLGLKEGK